jgi:hypothetical protein
MNVLANFLQGRESRRQQDAADRVSAMQQFVSQNGQALLNGDPNALGQLAGFDPGMALDIQGQQQTAARADRADARADVSAGREAWRFEKEVSDYAKGLSAEEAAAHAAQVEDAIKVALGAKTPEQFDALMTQMGQSDLVGQFENRDALAQEYMTMADVLKRNQPPEPMSPEGKLAADKAAGFDVSTGPEWQDMSAEEAAAQGFVSGQRNTKTGETKGQRPTSGMVITTNPDGTMSFQQGVGVGGKPFTEWQSKDIGFATRARGAESKLQENEDSLTGLKDNALGAVPFGLGKYAQSEPFKSADQAGAEWIVAFLRKDTGAAVTPQERQEYGAIYLPGIGDGPELIAQKRDARERAMRGMEAGMSQQEIAAQERALGAAPSAAAPPEATQTYTYNPDTGELE